MDEGFDEVDTNFVGIETLYRKCGTPFSSKSPHHKHLKNSYTSSVQSSLPNALTPALPIPIVNSKSVVPAMRSGIIFQVWTYATAAVTLIP